MSNLKMLDLFGFCYIMSNLIMLDFPLFCHLQTAGFPRVFLQDAGFPQSISACPVSKCWVFWGFLRANNDRDHTHKQYMPNTHTRTHPRTHPHTHTHTHTHPRARTKKKRRTLAPPKENILGNLIGLKE